MINYHTLNYLTEDVYSMNDGYSEEDINYELSAFFDRLMGRRRNDDTELGLQAGGVIYPDRAGFKICERDGKASHAQAQENVAQYLNGAPEYSSEEAVGMIGTRRNDPNSWANIGKNGFTVRIVACKEDLIFIFSTYKYQLTDFQIHVIYELFNHIRKVYEDGIIKYPYINFVTSRDRFVFNENADVDQKLEELESLLTKRKDSTEKKTR